MNPSEKAAYQGAVQTLGLAQRLTIKAVAAKNQQQLIFIILNDTYHLFPYDRAVLWRVTKQRAELLGVSGQATFTTASELVNHWKSLLKVLPSLAEAKLLKASDFPQHQEEWQAVQPKTGVKVMWIPIISTPEETVGLWFERWNEPEEAKEMQESAKVLGDHLIPGYAAAWEKNASHVWWRRLRDKLTRKVLGYLFLLLCFLLVFIRIPLRVSAPCEVVGKDPYVVTAPLEGIIAGVSVQPGQYVQKGDLLYTYDKRILQQELQVAQKQVEILQAETNRLMALGVENNQALSEMAIAKVKLEKGLVDLDFARYRLGQLSGTAPEEGLVIVEKPEDWRGRPVKIGEKIMIVSSPASTKVRVWVPETDNIAFDRHQPITIFLNPNPSKSYKAWLIYLSPEISITDQHIPSFLAEADWEEQPADVKLGLKGTAILYGERVTLFYYVMRKPIATLRRLTGI